MLSEQRAECYKLIIIFKPRRKKGVLRCKFDVSVCLSIYGIIALERIERLHFIIKVSDVGKRKVEVFISGFSNINFIFCTTSGTMICPRTIR